MELLADSLKFINRLGHGNTKLPAGFEFSPYIIVTHVSGIEDHNITTVGSFVNHFMSPNPMKTTADAQRLALEAMANLLGLQPDKWSDSGRGNFQGMARSYRDLYGAMVIISVGGLPHDQVAYYLDLMANLLHENYILFRGEN